MLVRLPPCSPRTDVLLPDWPLVCLLPIEELFDPLFWPAFWPPWLLWLLWLPPAPLLLPPPDCMPLLWPPLLWPPLLWPPLLWPGFCADTGTAKASAAVVARASASVLICSSE